MSSRRLRMYRDYSGRVSTFEGECNLLLSEALWRT